VPEFSGLEAIMSKVRSPEIQSQDEFAKYAAPVLLQMARMARRAKKDFASYLLEMAAAELDDQIKLNQYSK
jgi:hypothetical protein